MSHDVRPEELREAWPLLDAATRVEGFLDLEGADAIPFFRGLGPRSQAQILNGCPPEERGLWTKFLPPDDLADVVQELPVEDREAILGLLDDAIHREVTALLAYSEDDAGGLMNPRFVRARPEMTADEAIRYVRKQAVGQTVETIYYIYVLDAQQQLLGVLSVRELLAARPERSLREIMHLGFVKVADDLDREAVAKVIQRYDLLAGTIL